VINPEHDIATTQKHFGQNCGRPQHHQPQRRPMPNKPTAGSRAGPPRLRPNRRQLPPPQPTPDPKNLKAGQFMLYKQGPGCENLRRLAAIRDGWAFMKCWK
jgi:hypothetical protein